jgi:TonB family protein
MIIILAAALALQSSQSSKWSVDFADAYCEATRTYGSGETASKFSIRPPLDSSATTRLIFEHKILEVSGQLERSVTVDFGDGRPPFRTHTQPVLGQAGFRYILDLPEAQARRLRSATAIELNTSAKVDGRYEIVPTAPLFKALDRCTSDLRNRVGVSAEGASSSVQASPATSLDALFSSSKYWTVENHVGRTNEIKVSLLIDKAGSVRDCSVVTGTGSPALDTQTCQVFLRNTKFHPARNAKGEAVASLLHQSVKWRR